MRVTSTALAPANRVPLTARIAHIVSVSGSRAVAVLERSPLNASRGSETRIQIGMLVKIPTTNSSVAGLVCAMSAPVPSEDDGRRDGIELIEINLCGEIVTEGADGRLKFRRGVEDLPSLGDPVLHADPADLTCVYAPSELATIEVGTLFQDAEVPARLIVDELLGKHFIVVGTTGSGKSCTLACILQRVLDENAHAHVVVLDVHNEYFTAFGDKAELVTLSDLQLPFWLLNFQEMTAALTSADAHQEAEIEILGDAVLWAKRRYLEIAGRGQTLRKAADPANVTVESPTMFRLSDIISYIDEQLGKLERTHSAIPYRRLKSRIETLVGDQRYSFMFGNFAVQDTMADVLGRLLRIPGDGKPLTVIDLSSIPAEILDVVISVIARLAFDLAVWSKGGLPMLLVCEEAHRYAPAHHGEAFMPTRHALSRIAKEGRKYGVSLALVSQRPSELDETILSQCSTMIAMRLSNDRDQQVVRTNARDAALDLLDYLPLLGDREAVVLGQGVAMPMRIRFAALGTAAIPRNLNPGFSTSWKSPNMDRQNLEAIIARWRLSGREKIS